MALLPSPQQSPCRTPSPFTQGSRWLHYSLILFHTIKETQVLSQLLRSILLTLSEKKNSKRQTNLVSLNYVSRKWANYWGKWLRKISSHWKYQLFLVGKLIKMTLQILLNPHGICHSYFATTERKQTRNYHISKVSISLGSS